MRTWDLLSELPIDVEGYVLDPHEIPFPDGSARRTTVVRLQGGGLDGVGEDITYDAAAQLVLQDAGPEQPLAGSTTLAGFSQLLDGLDLSPGGGAPEAGASPDYRRWAFESAALDLALRQAGLSLAGALRREVHPLRFGVSFSLGDPPAATRIHELRARYPGTHFKLDATSAWTRPLADELAATGAVDVVDLKGYYVGTVVDQPADPVLYQLIVDAFPDSIVEDAQWAPAVEEILAPHRARLSFDAPIHSIDDVRALPFAPRVLNSQAVSLRHPRAPARLLRLRRGRGHRALRRRPVGALGRARPDPAPGGAVPSGRPERRRAASVQLARDRRRAADEPARAEPVGERVRLRSLELATFFGARPSCWSACSLIDWTISGSRSVVVSPISRPSAMSLSSRRMILPDRVFGRSSVNSRSFGLAIFPMTWATWSRSSWRRASLPAVDAAQDHEARDRLAGQVVLRSDHGGLGDRGVSDERALDLGRRDPVARHVDHVVDPAEQPVVAVGVALRPVAR